MAPMIKPLEHRHTARNMLRGLITLITVQRNEIKNRYICSTDLGYPVNIYRDVVVLCQQLGLRLNPNGDNSPTRVFSWN